MKKIRCLLLVMLMLCSMFIAPGFVDAIDQHEVADGTTFGSIYSETDPEGTELSHFDTNGDGCTYTQGLCTDGSNIWVTHNELWSEPSDHDYVYKYTMDGVYVGNWDYTSKCGEYDASSMATDGSNLWVLDPAAVPYTSNYYDVHKFAMDGTYIGNWSCTGINDDPVSITTDGNYIWILDSDDEVYKYSMAGTYLSSWDLDEIVDEPFWSVLGIATDGEFFWITEHYDDYVYKFTMDGEYTGEKWVFYLPPFDIATDGNYIWVTEYFTDEVYKFTKTETFESTRTVYAQTEKNNCSFTPAFSSTNATLKIPVSSDVKGIVDVTNNTGSVEATEVNTSDELVNNTFWYDSASQDVHIKTVNLTISSTVNWTINCSYGVNFNLIIPSYLEVGQQFFSSGFIEDGDGNAISNMVAETRLLYSNGEDALSVNPKHNCTGGNYFCTFSTSTLSPGIYSVSIEFTDPDTGIVFKEGQTLYLSYDVPGGSGIYSNAIVFFNFYNTNEGLGLPRETLKVYVDGIRQYDTTYYSYTNQVINVTIQDYYSTTLYSANHTILDTYTFLDFGLTFHSYKFCNKNERYYMISLLKTGSTRWYEKAVCPYETIEYVLPTGNYTLRIYNHTGIEIYNSTLPPSIVVNASMVYELHGTNLSEIISGQSIIVGEILEIQNETYDINNTVNDIGNSTGTIPNINSSVNDLINRSIVVISFYNTNEGLGLDRETLLVYVDGSRLIGNVFYCVNGSTINITVKDYYNFTLYQNDFSIDQPFYFIDLGLTFHSWLFGNKNDDYYMVSLLKDGASRWWERGIVPYSEREYLLPSGNYTMRIYDKDLVEIINQSYVIANSRVFVIHGTNLSEIIYGQSVIIGDLLELNLGLDYALMPDITIISRNPPIIFSIYDKEGMAFGNDFYMICPPLITIATTRVTQYGNWINSTPMIPGNGSVLNGTITIIRDVLYLSGPGSISWVNITYMNNGTLFQNTSYIPSRLDIYGQNLTINASGSISVIRETKYNQVRKFDWTYYPFSGYGPDLSRAGWHSAGIEVINSMPVPLYDVYVIAGFSDESNPDGSSVEVRDTTNGGIILDRGPSYDVTDTSIHFNIYTGMAAYETRAFTIGYYKMQQESYIYDEGIVSVPSFEDTVWDEGSYNFFPVRWSNPHSETFRGALYIKLNFDVPVGIDTTSMRIYDLTNDHEMDTTMFIPGDKYIRISAEGMGDVLPGGSRKFDVYFLMEVYPGADPTELHFDTPIFLGITLFLIILIIGLVLVGYGGYTYVFTKDKDWWKGIVIGIFLIVFFSILTAMGI